MRTGESESDMSFVAAAGPEFSAKTAANPFSHSLSPVRLPGGSLSSPTALSPGAVSHPTSRLRATRERMSSA